MMKSLFKKKPKTDTSNKEEQPESPKKKAKDSKKKLKEQPSNAPTLLPSGLPPNFAEKLLYLEMEMESESIDMENLKKLLELYATAIEYYGSIESDKYFIFKNKTQSLLLRSNVSSAMNKETSKKQQLVQPEKIIIQQPHSEPKQVEVNSIKEGLSLPCNIIVVQQQKEHQLKVQYINSQDSQENAKILLQQHQAENNYKQNIISGQISNQTNDVLSRLEMRRKSKIGKGFLNEIDGIFLPISPRQQLIVSDNNERKGQPEIYKSEEVTITHQIEETPFPIISSNKQESSDDEIDEIEESQSTSDFKKSIQSNRSDFQTPEKEQVSTRDDQIFQKKNDLQIEKRILPKWVEGPTVGNNDFSSSPVLVKLNSYGKREIKHLNNQWMMASTNNYFFN